MMRRNYWRGRKRRDRGAVRSGHGLLGGLCAVGAAAAVSVGYYGKGHRRVLRMQWRLVSAGGKYCVGFGGGMVDRRFGDEVVRVLSPLGIQASLQVLDQLGVQDDARRRCLRASSSR